VNTGHTGCVARFLFALVIAVFFAEQLPAQNVIAKIGIQWNKCAGAELQRRIASAM